MPDVLETQMAIRNQISASLTSNIIVANSLSIKRGDEHKETAIYEGLKVFYGVYPFVGSKRDLYKCYFTEAEQRILQLG